MGRFLASTLAGILVIIGGWLGWSESARVQDGLASAAGLVLPSSGESTARVEDPEGVPLSSTGTEPSPPCPFPGPATATGMDDVMTRLDSEPTLQGGDHGGSVVLADGRRMLVYGDTIRDTTEVSPFMVRNSALVLDGSCVRPVDGERGEALIPDDPDGTGYWPMSLRAVEVPGGTVVQVVTNRVRQVGDGAADAPDSPDSFQTLGSSLATFEVPEDREPRYVGQVRLTPDSTDPRVPTWGAAMWEHDGVIHVFGTASNATKSTAGWSLHVARTTPEHLGDPGAWEYWDGQRWVPGDPTAAQAESARLIPAEQGVSHVLSVFERDGSWYAVSKEGDYHGDTLAIWKAPSVTGPWTKHEVRPLENSDGIRRYTPLAHPDADLASGQLLVSWSEAPVDLGRYRTDPDLYRPRFAEVSLP